MDKSPATYRLRLIATSDLHGCLRGYDYLRDRPDELIGLTRLATLIRKAREEEPNAILLDAGDLLQGNLMAEVFAEPGREVHPLIAAMNHLQFDAMALGNHDLDYGLDTLLHHANNADFPVLSANLTFAAGQPLLPATTMVRRALDGTDAGAQIKVGIVGLSLPEVPLWARRDEQLSLVARDILDTARAEARRLKQEDGADVVVALAHTGLHFGPRRGGETESGADLADLEDIDAVICGHLHDVFPDVKRAPHSDTAVNLDAGTINGTPCVMPGRFGSHLGVIDLQLAEKQGGGYSVVSGSAGLRGLTRAEPVPEACDLVTLVQSAHEQTRQRAINMIGSCPWSINSHFSLLGADAYLTLLARVQRRAAEDAGLLTPGLPVVSVVSPFKTGGKMGPQNFTNVTAGEISYRALSDIYPFNNDIVTIDLSGRQIRWWLERAANQFRRIMAFGPEVGLLHPDVPGFLFDTMFGLKYRIDLGMSPGWACVSDITIDGVPLADEMHCCVITNNFRANMLVGAEGIVDAEKISHGSVPFRQALKAALSTPGDLFDAPPSDRVWELRAPRGATAIIDTAPGADPATMLPGRTFGLEPLGLSTHGFQRFRLLF